MELRETIESINYKLEKEFGKEFNGSPRFRVVFSEDQFEKRWTECTDDGFQLLHPEVRELPKYKQHIHQKYILERFIPIIGETDLTTNMNYEPMWVFQDKNGDYLPPWFDGCKFVIEVVLEQAGHKGHTKYKDESLDEEVRSKQLMTMKEALFGNDTDVSDHLGYGSGVVVPKDVSDLMTSAAVVEKDEKVN